MADHDELIRAGINALYGYAGQEDDAAVTDSESARQVATVVVGAVLPLIEADLRERLAAEIEALEPPRPIKGGVMGAISWVMGKQAAASIVRGATADTEPKEAFE